MPIENRELAVGTRLVARYKKADRTCEIVETTDGPRYRLDDGTEHRSPSSAGKAAMGGVACNGWRFWSVQGTEKVRAKAGKTVKEAAATKPAEAKQGANTAKKTKATKQGKAARMRATDVPSYGCGVCPATFGSQKAAIAHAMSHTA